MRIPSAGLESLVDRNSSAWNGIARSSELLKHPCWGPVSVVVVLVVIRSRSTKPSDRCTLSTSIFWQIWAVAL